MLTMPSFSKLTAASLHQQPVSWLRSSTWMALIELRVIGLLNLLPRPSSRVHFSSSRIFNSDCESCYSAIMWVAFSMIEKTRNRYGKCWIWLTDDSILKVLFYCMAAPKPILQSICLTTFSIFSNVLRHSTKHFSLFSPLQTCSRMPRQLGISSRMHPSVMLCILLSSPLSKLTERLATLSWRVRVCWESLKSRASNSRFSHCSVKRKWERRLVKSCRYSELLSSTSCQERTLSRKDQLYSMLKCFAFLLERKMFRIVSGIQTKEIVSQRQFWTI